MMVLKLKSHLPWWSRIAAKIILARLPVNYAWWKRLGLFVHGEMNRPARALETFLVHAKTAGVLPMHDDFAVLELGPGDSLFTALIASAIGAKRVWLVDAGAFAVTEPAAYREMAAYLNEQGSPLPFPMELHDMQDVLDACNAEYLTEGTASMARIPDKLIDYCFSNAVLEHVPKNDVPVLARELKRVLKPNGICVHRIDLQDHLGGGLNNLRFSENTWEGALFSRSGFYTNRIRYGQMLEIFQDAGFECAVPRKVTWESLPISRTALAAEFCGLPDEDLLVRGFDLILRPRGA